MKKATVLLVALFAFAAFAFLPNATYACGETAEKTTATKASASACTAKAEKANATQASASGCSASGEKATATQASGAGCAASATAANAKMVNGEKACNPADCNPADCDPATCMAKYEMVSMNISGMTCGSCEASVTAALQKMDGVVSVKKVCSKSGTAIVYVDPAKMKDKSLMMTAVADKGFKAEIVPAVAMTSDASAVNADGKICSAADKAACAAACAAKKVSTTAKTISAEGTK